MSGSFVAARIEELPTSLDGPQGRGWATALGQPQDAEQLTLTNSVLLRYPPRTPDDALDHLGVDSNIERFDGEPSGTVQPPTGYHGRLLNRWKTWKEAGSAQAITDSFAGYGLPQSFVYQDFQGTFAPGSWYSRFWVVIGPHFGTTGIGPLQMPFKLGGTLGSTATRQQVIAIKRQVLKWKSAHSYPVRVILQFVGTTLLGITPNGPLQMPFKLGGTHESCRWNIGKLFGVDQQTNMPFKMGGFIL